MDDIKLLLATFGFILLLVFVILLGIAYPLEKYSCHKYSQKLNYKYEYDIWTGCILQDNNGHKFLLEQLREVKQ